MSRPVIRVENLSKLYQLGEMGTGQISSDVAVWWKRAFGGKDTEWDSTPKESKRTDYWALKDISFDVNQGDVLGIIGKNGAGKSTLLKILSRITSPTSGTIKVKGRIASLLEVGTGFHPELSGRDNVYLNGSFLGMKKWEIDKRFDEIVDFSGIEKFIDTPVKRYSSGMYVRLAFAVAAHLEPEILIIDEVLAVGDAEFQKKCLGKMKDVSLNQGRTVIFVSHDMNAVTKLCTTGIYLKNGQMMNKGMVGNIITDYMQTGKKSSTKRLWTDLNEAPGNDFVRLKEVTVLDSENKEGDIFDIRKSIFLKVKYMILNDRFTYTHGINLFNEDGIHVLSSHNKNSPTIKSGSKIGEYTIRVELPGNFLAEGRYTISFAIISYNPFIIHFHEMDLASFIVKDTNDGDSARGDYGGKIPGVVRPILNWIND